MQLELKDEKGLLGTIELPLEQIKEALGLGSASVETEAQLQESQGKVAELEEKLTRAEGKTIGDFSSQEKAAFLIPWLQGLSPEDKAIFAEAAELPIAVATDAEVAEAEAKEKGEGKEVKEATIIKGRTTRPGFKFLEYLNLSVKES